MDGIDAPGFDLHGGLGSVQYSQRANFGVGTENAVMMNRQHDAMKPDTAPPEEFVAAVNPVASVPAPTKRHRRWRFQYSLRTLFIGMTLLAIPIYQGTTWWRQIRDEEEACERLAARQYTFAPYKRENYLRNPCGGPPAWFCWLVGKSDYREILGIWCPERREQRASYYGDPSSGIEVHGEDSGVPEDLVELAKLPHIKTFNLVGREMNDDAIRAIATLSNLSELRIHRANVTDLGPLSVLRKLRHLDFTEVSRSVDLRPLADLPIMSLTIQGDGINDQMIAGLANWKSLRYLGINCSSAFTGTTLAQLATVPIEEFGLNSGTETWLDKIDLSGMRGWSSLRHIYIRANISAENAAHLAEIHSLTTLTLHSSVFDNDALLVLSKSSSLECLEIRGSTITDDGLRSFRNFANLRELTLINTPVVGDGFQHLKDRGIPKLRVEGKALRPIALWHLAEFPLSNELSVPSEFEWLADRATYERYVGRAGRREMPNWAIDQWKTHQRKQQ